MIMIMIIIYSTNNNNNYYLCGIYLLNVIYREKSLNSTNRIIYDVIQMIINYLDK